MTSEQKKAFIGKWIKHGYILASRAERLGMDPNSIPVWKLQTQVDFMENLGKPESVSRKQETLEQRR